MITRSASKAQAELSRSVQKRRRLRRKRRLAAPEVTESPYNLRSAMGKKGGNSSQAVGGQTRRPGASIGRDDVSPRTLKYVEEDGTPIQNPRSKVCSNSMGTMHTLVNFVLW